MPYDLYWYGDCWAVRIFSDAYERKREEANYNAWLNGAYVYTALSAAIGATLSKKGSSKNIKYVDYPYSFTEREKKMEKIRRIKHTLDFINKGKNQK